MQCRAIQGQTFKSVGDRKRYGGHAGKPHAVGSLVELREISAGGGREVVGVVRVRGGAACEEGAEATNGN